MKLFTLITLSLSVSVFASTAISKTTSISDPKVVTTTQVESEIKMINKTADLAKVKAASDSTSQSVDKYEGIDITVNINTATLEELSALLIGIGNNKAQLIIDYREKHGPFSSNEALMEVKGIGPSTIQKNANRIIL